MELMDVLFDAHTRNGSIVLPVAHEPSSGGGGGDVGAAAGAAAAFDRLSGAVNIVHQRHEGTFAPMVVMASLFDFRL